MAGDRDRAIEAGCVDYHTKPVELPKLLAQIEALLTARPPEAIDGASPANPVAGDKA